MPFNVQIWVEDCDDGRFNVYVVDTLVKDDGARALEGVLNSTITGWKRLDDSMVRTALRVVNG
ncbi:hypothetical protein ABZ387_06775 [Streptomyces flaveolus]|jgi:hypothetical protein|uniref:hypothetical protein n=1 Tax=Streptomyces flaveolus TaxID=67297 RepID=UPI00340188B2